MGRARSDIQGQSMPQLTVVMCHCSEKTVTGQVGLSLMEVIRDNGFDGLRWRSPATIDRTAQLAEVTAA